MKNRIKEIISERPGLTVAGLAKKVGITQPNMSNIVNGKTNPSLETLEKIALALNVEIVELFEEKTDIYGVVIFGGKTYKINSRKALEELYNLVK